MGILDEIVAHKRTEVASRKELYPIKLLEQSIYFETKPVSLSQYLLRPGKLGLIAEIKRKSPSAGLFHEKVSVEEISIGYMQAGASALSVLTDEKYFGGSNEDLTLARRFNFCPVLRKDFVVDEYQIVEAKSIGADAVLLIARVLDSKEIQRLAAFAHQLQLEVLVEVHSKEELEQLSCEHVDVLGVNNRNLDTLVTDVQLSLSLAEHLPEDCVPISESGISSANTLHQLSEAGYHGFLIGESFMRTIRPQDACRQLIQHYRALQEGRGEL